MITKSPATSSDSKLQSRVHLIDEIRGFAIICMVVYHLIFDLVAYNIVVLPIFSSEPVQFLVSLFVCIFVFISGSACAFSRNNLKRGIICFMLGMLMTVVTFFVVPELIIKFGILHMLGISMILYSLIAPALKKLKLSPFAVIIAGALLFLLCYNVTNGYLGFKGIISIPLPKALYDVGFLFPLGFPSDSFFSADYFGIIPWFFCFFAGSGFGNLLKERKMPEFFYKQHIKPLCFIGRHTLIIYLLHQPIAFGLIMLINTIIK